MTPSTSEGWQLTAQNRWLLVLFALSPLVYVPFANWMAIVRHGTSLFLWGQAIYGAALVAAVLTLPVALVSLVFRRTRRKAFLGLSLSVLFLICCTAGIVMGERIRMSGMAGATERARPLVTAIERYERDRGEPPPALEVLVPEFLSAIPSTGLGAYPEFDYFVGEKAEQRFAGNPWVLSIFTPSGGINFDQMLYFPRSNYADWEHGNAVERVVDWGYHHE